MATWINGSGDPCRVGTTHFARDDDLNEVAAAINRRRRIVYFTEQDFSGQFEPDEAIEYASLTASEQLRPQFATVIGSFFSLGGDPPSPTDACWLWPVDDGDENDEIVTGTPGQGQVNFFAKMNGTNTWTDPTLTAASSVRAAHVNEMRWGIEHLTRGRLELPIYFGAGIFSPLPDTPWLGDAVANSGSHELRSVGFALLRTADSPPRGLVGATVRTSSRLYVEADSDCQVELYRCKRAVDFVADPPTWNRYDPSGEMNWQVAGCGGDDDRELIGGLSLTADEPDYLTGQNIADALQEMVAGAEQNFMIRRGDTGEVTVEVRAWIVVEFDLDVPPS